MPSAALHTWKTTGKRALDEIEAAHAAVGGSGPGRRYATQQINQAYVVLLASQFQRFCRDLHTEAIDHVSRRTPFPQLERLLWSRLSERRKLDTGNPNPGNIGSDFARFEMDFWDLVQRRDRRNAKRQAKLEQLNQWRNAIAHQDFAKPVLGGRDRLRLTEVRAWRSVCETLAVDFDEAVRVHLIKLVGVAPW